MAHEVYSLPLILHMSNRIAFESMPGMPEVNLGDNVGAVIVDAATRAGYVFQEDDVVCVASKVVSIAEGRFRALDDIDVSAAAAEIHDRVPRKDPRVVQVIIDETGEPDGSRVSVDGGHISGWLQNGLRLTSAGVDKFGTDKVILLPEDADASAREIGKCILGATGVRVGVIITDSDGRKDKRGATQVAIGVYGVPPLRTTETATDDGSVRRSEETTCDMIAAAAGLLMGQRGTGRPVVVVSGFEYTFDDTVSIRDATNG